ncbi:Uncharacterized protein LW93_1345 [Fusarium fujikuroi]|nr:Uncharacterized protein LW93_1345 [Fusarium fujikuroi]
MLIPALFFCVSGRMKILSSSTTSQCMYSTFRFRYKHLHSACGLETSTPAVIAMSSRCIATLEVCHLEQGCGVYANDSDGQQHDTITNHHQELIIWYHMPSSHHQQDAHKTENPINAQIPPTVRINTLIHLISLPRLSLTRVSPRPITLSCQTLSGFGAARDRSRPCPKIKWQELKEGFLLLCLHWIILSSYAILSSVWPIRVSDMHWSRAIVWRLGQLQLCGQLLYRHVRTNLTSQYRFHALL